MAQQTPLARVEPVWCEWIARWPTASSLAAEPPGEVVRAWGRLGYPRRALRLREAAIVLTERHGGRVPQTEPELLALPGVGAYTAAAVAAFAHGTRTTVVDTNVRRVLARVVTGVAQAGPSLTRAESELARSLVPADHVEAATWNVAAMELGALVCTARSPRCADCPLTERCAWYLAGRPSYDGPARRRQAWQGTDRQVRGRALQALREAAKSLDRGAFEAAAPDRHQVDRCLDALVADGLVQQLAGGRYRLPV